MISGMSDNMSVVDKIRANAELVAGVAADELKTDVGYDEAGVRWLDAFIQRHHEKKDPELNRSLVSTLGSYLGECIIQTFGGSWAQVDGSWAVRFDERNAAFPFAKVAKQLDNGAEDSVLSFFTMTPILFKKKPE